MEATSGGDFTIFFVLVFGFRLWFWGREKSPNWLKKHARFTFSFEFVWIRPRSCQLCLKRWLLIVFWRKAQKSWKQIKWLKLTNGLRLMGSLLCFLLLFDACWWFAGGSLLVDSTSFLRMRGSNPEARKREKGKAFGWWVFASGLCFGLFGLLWFVWCRLFGLSWYCLVCVVCSKDDIAKGNKIPAKFWVSKKLWYAMSANRLGF